MNRLKLTKQAGLSLRGLLLVIVATMFCSYIAIRIFPIYLENFSVSSSLQSIVEERITKKSSPAEIRQRLMKRLKTNNVGHVKDDHIEISDFNGLTKIKINYEVKTHFLGNISLVLNFEQEEVIRD